MPQHLSSALAASTVTSGRSRRSSTYELVNDRILEALRNGVVPWRKPWYEVAPPCNGLSNRPYHGVNFFLLSLSRYLDHRWVTFKQARQLGGFVRANETGWPIVFWKRWSIDEPDPATGEVQSKSIPILRHFFVFNVEQCEGLDLPKLDYQVKPANEGIAAAEALVAGVPDPPRMHLGSKQACYYPAIDVVQMPAIEVFRTADDYYATLFHELGHATGHEKRLNRAGVTTTPRFGSLDYGREELVAELTSAYLSATAGLDTSLVENAASYLEGWWQLLKADPKAFVVAAGQAHRAADYLRGIQRDAVEASEPESVPR